MARKKNHLTLEDIEQGIKDDWAALAEAKKKAGDKWTPLLEQELLYAKGLGLSWSEVVDRWRQKYGWGNEKNLSKKHKDLTNDPQ